MDPWLIALPAAALAIIVAAFVIYRRADRRRMQAPTGAAHQDRADPLMGGRRRSFWDHFRFIEGPFEISVALHVAIVLALLWWVHLPSGSNLITVNLQGGGGGGSQELKQLNLPEMAMPAPSEKLSMARPRTVTPRPLIVRPSLPPARLAFPPAWLLGPPFNSMTGVPA